MSHHFTTIDRTEATCVKPLAMYFQDLFMELCICRTHFHQNQEYLNVPLIAILKNHRLYSFKRFVSIVKVYLGLRGRAFGVRVGVGCVWEYCHKLTIENGQFKETVRGTLAQQDAIDLFQYHVEKPFVFTCWCSPTIEEFCLWMISFIRKSRPERERDRRHFRCNDGYIQIFVKGGSLQGRGILWFSILDHQDHRTFVLYT